MFWILSLIPQFLHISDLDYSGLSKLGAWLNYSGFGVMVASSSSIETADEIIGHSLDEWKVYGVIIGAICGVLGLIAQVTFKYLDYKHKRETSLKQEK